MRHPSVENEKQSQIVLGNARFFGNVVRMDLEIIGVGHVYLTVSDLKRAEAFHDW